MSGAAGRGRQRDEVCARHHGVRLLEVASYQVDEGRCDRYEIGCRPVECRIEQPLVGMSSSSSPGSCHSVW